MFKNNHQSAAKKRKKPEELTPQYNKNNQTIGLLEMLRANLIGELQAINQYERHARMTDNRTAQELFQEIANDEKHHIADLLKMIARFDEQQRKQLGRRLCNEI